MLMAVYPAKRPLSKIPLPVVTVMQLSFQSFWGLLSATLHKLRQHGAPTCCRAPPGRSPSSCHDLSGWEIQRTMEYLHRQLENNIHGEI